MDPLTIAEYAEQYLKAFLYDITYRSGALFTYSKEVPEDIKTLSPYQIRKVILEVETNIIRYVNTLWNNNKNYSPNIMKEGIITDNMKTLRKFLFKEIDEWQVIKCGNNEKNIELENENVQLKEEIKRLKGKLASVYGLLEGEVD